MKISGYWPISFCVFMDQDGVEVHKHAKKERGQYQAILTEQAWSIKDLLYGFQENDSCGTQLLPARVATQRRIWFVSPAHGASHMIIELKSALHR